ncbi:MAG: bifunctional DNA-formamidopyrimidine glycosylase/DNA-(apurinic or apyrimidinic site) lyase [Calditrichaeota bacterium]|nr:bifunctional DNA-formamidopyrimidine glycosylase/DNA-(apurinic or apyrimidinic site) lyase [Calditrichota bacterium]MCB9368615.1 bifunctional DNA-formamidopyrimidine glycosylase/DNA-(apurinic or apyrimidinic site) lyase [Calditrichota bacterium]
MPELPEVETAVRELRPNITGRVLCGVTATIPRQLGDTTAKELARFVKNRRVIAVERRGKYIVLELDRGVLLFHLRMTGRLYVAPTTKVLPDYVRAAFSLDDKSLSLYFRDVRTLGTIRFYNSVDEAPELRALGWEPLTTNASAAELKEILRTRSQGIKVVLLDQSIWAGIGNIYASETCWVAGVDPRKSAKLLSLAQCERLCQAVPQVLERALEKGGSTLRDFMSPDGKYGSYQKEFRVYDREGEKCLRCGGTIARIVQAQRSTFFCPKCQKKR